MKRLLIPFAVLMAVACTDEYDRKQTINFLSRYISNIEPKDGCDVYGDFDDGYAIGKICVNLVSNNTDSIALLEFDSEQPLITATFNTVENDQKLIEEHISAQLDQAFYNPSVTNIYLDKLPISLGENIGYSVNSFAVDLLECELLNNAGDVVRISTPVNGHGQFLSPDEIGRYSMGCTGEQSYSGRLFYQKAGYIVDVASEAEPPFVSIKILKGIDSEGSLGGSMMLTSAILNESGAFIEDATSVSIQIDGLDFYEMEKSFNGEFSFNAASFESSFITSVKVVDSESKFEVVSIEF